MDAGVDMILLNDVEWEEQLPGIRLRTQSAPDGTTWNRSPMRRHDS